MKSWIGDIILHPYKFKINIHLRISKCSFFGFNDLELLQFEYFFKIKITIINVLWVICII